MGFQGALVIKSAAQAVPDGYYGGGYTYLTFDPTAYYDTDGFYDPMQPDRLIVPPALVGRWAKVKISVRWQQLNGNKVQILPALWRDGLDWRSGYPECAPDNRHFVGGTTTDHMSETHPVKLLAGDAYRAAAWQSSAYGSGVAIDVQAGSFSLEILD